MLQRKGKTSNISKAEKPREQFTQNLDDRLGKLYGTLTNFGEGLSEIEAEHLKAISGGEKAIELGGGW